LIHKATGHPLRRRILRILRAADEPLAPSDLQEEIPKEGLPNLGYHVRVLHEAGLVDLVKTEPRRGAVKHFYAPSGLFTPELRDTLAVDRIAELLEEEAAEITDGVLNEIVDIIVAAGRPIR